MNDQNEALRIFSAETSVDGAPPVGLARVRARVQRTLAGSAAGRTPWRREIAAGAWVGAGMVAVAIGALAIRAPEVPLDVALAPSAGQVALAPLRAVTARIDGTGTLAGTPSHPWIQWDHGSIEVEVDPDRGPDLVVSTADATVTVTGTVFRVDRDLLGTQVRVTRGSVDVRCAGGEVVHVTAGEQHECLPATPAGLLGRARAQAKAAAPADEVLATVDKGLPSAEGPVRVELRVVRIEQLVRAGRVEEALREASAFLGDGGDLRRADVARIAAAAALQRSDCARATPFLQVVVDEGSATREERDQLRRCERREQR